MTTFDERERAYEKKFSLDQELKFKAEARRNRLVGRMGGSQVEPVWPGRRRLRQTSG